MEKFFAVLLFDLALLVPPLAVVLGIVMLAVPSRTGKVVRTIPSAHAA